MGIETLIIPAKLSYEEWLVQQPVEIWDLLFPMLDVDDIGTFMMDKFIQSPYGISYRDVNGFSTLRPYAAGTGYLYEVPRSSAKTRIGEDMREMAITGVDAKAPRAAHYKKMMDDIVKDHASGYVMTKRKQALDVMFASTFYALGVEGTDLDLDIAFTRDSDNTQTHDFTASDTQPIALKEMQDQLIAKGCSPNNMVVIMGSTWLSDFFADTSVTAYLTSNPVNELLTQNMVPEQLRNCYGLRVVATYRAPTMVAPVWVCTYQPAHQYVAYKGAAAAAWVTATKCAMFSLDSPRYHIKRGMDVLNESGKIERAVGDVVFDTFVDKEPVGEYFRSNTRHVFLPANTDHICTSTGTFS